MEKKNLRYLKRYHRGRSESVSSHRLEARIGSSFNQAGEYMDFARKDAACAAMNRRMEHLRKLAQTHPRSVDRREADAVQDEAADYNMKIEM